MSLNFTPEEIDELVKGAPTKQPAPELPPLPEEMEELRRRASSCLFYPAAMRDWSPLHWFSHNEFGCNTFAFCDQGLHLPDLDDLRSPYTGLGGPQRFSAVSALSTPSEFKLPALSRSDQDRFIELMRTSTRGGDGDWWLERERPGYRVEIQLEEPTRRVVLFYFACDAVACYFRLFRMAGISPNTILLKNWGDNTLCPWDYSGPLGKLVEGQAATPRFVANCFGDRYNWPWRRRSPTERVPEGMKVYER